MILIFNKISELCTISDELVEKNIICDYRLSLKINNDITLFLLINDETSLNTSDYYKIYNSNKIKIEVITQSDCKSDIFYEDLFTTAEKISFESRRRFSNLLNIRNQDYKSPCPVVTFYSYKGGMGRSTTIAACASFLSLHYKKRIVIIDCDLEAPGFTNYFLDEPDVVNYKNGLVEYLLDKDFNDYKTSISKYSWEVSKEYSGKGEIRIIPAGNLSDEPVDKNHILHSHRKHYLEGLSRIDISSTSFIVKQFRDLIFDIYDEYNPDLIFIDSRTGFNDIFGITAFNLSSLLIGFFGANVQNTPGLHFFLDSIKDIKSNLQAILVNSIIPSTKYFSSFEDHIDRYLTSITKEEEELIVIDKFPITRNMMLENIGTKDEYKPDFINLIKNKQFLDYNELFEKINDLTSKINYDENYSDIEIIENNLIDDTHIFLKNIDYNNLTDTESLNLQLQLKKKILTNLRKNWPELYAKNINYEKEFKENRYFYRSCMEDIFNSSKFLIMGNKGTGKTYLYQSLKNINVVKKLQERANKKQYSYEFFHLIDNSSDKYLDTNKFDSIVIKHSEIFYEKFWIVYIWNAIMLESEERLGYKSKLEILPIKDDTRTKNRFLQIINNDNELIKIEDDLYNLDKYLSEKTDKQLIVIFDELDEIVKPIKWSEKITPLIQLWRKNTYSKIFPKLFIRSDLFNKLSNITNVKELKNLSISIEWTSEELFSYFFKLVFSHSKEEFFAIMRLYNNFTNDEIKLIKSKAGEDNQLPLEMSYLKPPVETFFGKYAGIDNNPRFGESYNWFFKNLKNSDLTISLRPFIDLLEEAMKYAISEDRKPRPILTQFYYVHGEARKNAVQRHFEDLATEKGNTDLKYIFEYIRTKANERYKLLFLQQSEFEALLLEIIRFYGNKLENNTIDSLKALLKVNGIISEKFYSGGVEYFFAFLYKYYLGLKNKPKKTFTRK